MSFFPSDWDEEEGDDFQGNLEDLVHDFERKSRDDFSPRELLEIYKYYQLNQPLDETGFKPSRFMKMALEKGVNEFPYLPVFALHMAEILILERNLRLSRKYLAQAKEYNAFEPALFFLEAVTYFIEDKKEKGDELLIRGFELSGEDDDVLTDVCILLIHHGLFKEALPLIKGMLERGSDATDILNEWMNDVRNPQLNKELIPFLEKQVDNFPYNEDAWYLLGRAWFSVEDFTKAHWAYDYAVTINENFPEAWIGILESLYEAEKYPAFIKTFNEQKEKFGWELLEEIKGLYAWSLYESGDATESRKVYREILQKNPQDNESWYSMGLTWHYEQNFKAAIPFLERAFELKHTEPDYGIVLAAAYFGNGDEEKWQILYEMLSLDHPMEDELWLDWGIALYEIGETDKCIEVTQKGLKFNPDSYRLMYRLGALCYLNGQTGAAEYLIEAALKANPNEHLQMFIFAPALKKATSLIRLIAKYVEPNIQ